MGQIFVWIIFCFYCLTASAIHEYRRKKAPLFSFYNDGSPFTVLCSPFKVQIYCFFTPVLSYRALGSLTSNPTPVKWHANMRCFQSCRSIIIMWHRWWRWYKLNGVNLFPWFFRWSHQCTKSVHDFLVCTDNNYISAFFWYMYWSGVSLIVL